MNTCIEKNIILRSISMYAMYSEHKHLNKQKKKHWSSNFSKQYIRKGFTDILNI